MLTYRSEAAHSPVSPSRESPPRLAAADVDRLLIRLFEDEDDDDALAASQQIPPQAFEQLFGVYTLAVACT